MVLLKARLCEDSIAPWATIFFLNITACLSHLRSSVAHPFETANNKVDRKC